MFLWYLRDVKRFGRFKTKLWCRKMPQISTHKSLTQSQLRWLSKQNNWSIIQSRKSWKSNWHWNRKSDYVEAPESRYSISRQERNLENDLSNSERERQTNYETWRQLLWFQKSDESRGSWTSISRKEREEQTNYENWRQH